VRVQRIELFERDVTLLNLKGNCDGENAASEEYGFATLQEEVVVPAVVVVVVAAAAIRRDLRCLGI